jgi:hypothetical protein
LLQRLLEVSMLFDVLLLLPVCAQSPHAELTDYTEDVLVTVSDCQILEANTYGSIHSCE